MHTSKKIWFTCKTCKICQPQWLLQISSMILPFSENSREIPTKFINIYHKMANFPRKQWKIRRNKSKPRKSSYHLIGCRGIITMINQPALYFPGVIMNGIFMKIIFHSIIGFRVRLHWITWEYSRLRIYMGRTSMDSEGLSNEFLHNQN